MVCLPWSKAILYRWQVFETWSNFLEFGDVIYILHSGSVLYILGPAGRHRYRLVGECYSEGLMEGQADDYWSQKKGHCPQWARKSREITLYWCSLSLLQREDTIVRPAIRFSSLLCRHLMTLSLWSLELPDRYRFIPENCKNYFAGNSSVPIAVWGC